MKFCSALILGFFLLLGSGGSVCPAISRADLKTVTGDRFILDLRYHTAQNFLGKDVYSPFHLDTCLVRPEAFKLLEKLATKLREKKLKLILFDCFRPVSVQKEMWALVPDARYVADPKVGSNHNRGVAVDVTLADEQGKPLSMPTGFDNFTPKAFAHYHCTPQEKQECRNRKLLQRLMTGVGFKIFPTEWWHFQLPHPQSYPLIAN